MSLWVLYCTIYFSQLTRRIFSSASCLARSSAICRALSSASRLDLSRSFSRVVLFSLRSRSFFLASRSFLSCSALSDLTSSSSTARASFCLCSASLRSCSIRAFSSASRIWRSSRSLSRWMRSNWEDASRFYRSSDGVLGRGGGQGGAHHAGELVVAFHLGMAHW
uniref:Uncharacterized protein n=1 Tax=Corethron hystrix TaxID=216773 RepID=A0A6U5HZV7_9STRA